MIDHFQEEYIFYIITRDTDYCENLPYENVNSDAWNSINKNSQVFYFSKEKLSFRTIIKITKSIDFDVVYINGIYSMYFSLLPLIYFKYFTKKKLIVAARGMLSAQTFTSKGLKKNIFFKVCRNLGLYNKINFHATNNEEALSIRQTLNFKGNIILASNLPPRKNHDFQSSHKEPGNLHLISIARISEEKNTLFAIGLLEKVKHLDITFDLYGTIYNQQYWKECHARISQLPANIKINYKGSIEKEKIVDTVKKYHFLLMPTTGENYGHSIVESFIAGRPVIISNRTPWLQLQEKGIGWDLPLDKSEEFVKVIEFCAAMNQQEYDQLSQAAFDFSQSIINDPSVIEANRFLFS